MKIFIDTANVEEIRKASKLGVLAGVTTNPSLIAKEGRDIKEVIEEICSIVDGPISAEVMALECDEMVREGIATSLNGEKLDGVTLLQELNKIGGKHGIGVIDMVENRLVGMKSRGVYETPGGSILYKAHKDLEELCLDKETSHYKEIVSLKFADLVYNGQWFTPLREALSAFISKTQETVTGEIKLKLYKGNIINAGMTSPYSLYSEEYATFGEDGIYDQKDAEGFINLFSLPSIVQAKMAQKLN